MLVLCGKSATGKSSIESVLSSLYGYKKIVSYTTRKPRDGEVDGVDYHFVSEEEFLNMKSLGLFAESSYHYMWHYGFLKSDCCENAVVVLNPKGLRDIKRSGIHCRTVYIKADDRKRLCMLIQRGDDIVEVFRRHIFDDGMFNGMEEEVDVIYENDYTSSIQDAANKIHILYGGGEHGV